MRKRQINKFHLWLILTAIPVIICFSFAITVHQNDAYKKRFKLAIEDILINNQVYGHFNNETKETLSVFYRLSSDDRYHYEFRFEFNPSTQKGDHRVMLILNGDSRSCADTWDFFVGRRIVRTMKYSGYSILAICSQRKTFDLDVPIEQNKDAKYIYFSFQRWIKHVYYARFQHYPLLYIHATSRGSKFAGILCRILPIQAQILYIFIGQQDAMLAPSSYDSNLQRRLSLDPTFANWFYFDFCYDKTVEDSEDRKVCPFQEDRNYYYPVPPTFCTFLENDPSQNKSYYKNFITDTRKSSLHLGGILLSRIEALQLDILPYRQPTVSYLQVNFPVWRSKLYAIELFLEHFNNPEKYRTTDPQRITYWCLNIDFKYFENYPNITMTWTETKQFEYNDYIKDIRQYADAFTEEVCGDIMASHAMVSRNINEVLDWTSKMDQLRRSLYIDDYLKRPLRIWMYDKKLLLKSAPQYSAQEPQWTNISKEYLMYSPEYFIQDYFQRLSIPGEIQDKRFQWTVNPLLADYFIIPSDLIYFYFYHDPPTLKDKEFKELLSDLNGNYFNTLLTNIRTNYPYWTLANGEDQMGANHILTIPGGRNMGMLTKTTRNILKNVIQLVFTGVREDLISSRTQPRYTYRGMHITYRHHYDVVLPQFTKLNMNRSKSDDIDALVQKKNRLFYFAGALSHTTSILGARAHLSLLLQDMIANQNTNMTVEIQDRNYHLITIINGHVQASDYIQSLQSTIFSLCPEGFLPWSPRLYESIQIGAVPVILADNIVVPFERFIDWRSMSAKINVSTIRKIDVLPYRIHNLEEYTKEKLKSALQYLYAFRWPYLLDTKENHDKLIFQLPNATDERANNTFYYLSLELRCRRLEQWYGLTFNTTTVKSLEAKRLACTNHPTICPCHNETNSLAFKEYY